MPKEKVIVPKGSIRGYTIVGSRARGTRDLLFKTKKQAMKFKLGGKIRKAYRTPHRIKPILLKNKEFPFIKKKYRK